MLTKYVPKVEFAESGKPPPGGIRPVEIAEKLVPE
jgi:hypothetical protein